MRRVHTSPGHLAGGILLGSLVIAFALLFTFAVFGWCRLCYRAQPKEGAQNSLASTGG
jgi:hypothetical protein